MTARSAAGDALRAKVRYIVDRPIARVRIKPLQGAVTGPAQWRKDVGNALADLRLFLIGSRPRTEYQNMLVRSAIAECARLEIEEALRPIFEPAARVEWQLSQIASMRREPWAHSQHQVNRSQM
jgi:hypothetical protein